MNLSTPLDRLFATGSHVRVLRTLFRSPVSRGMSARDVARSSGLSHPTVLRVMPVLLDQGIVVVTRRLRLDLYELDRDHALAPGLEDLFAAEAALFRSAVEHLRDRIDADAPGIQEAYVFGSAARGEMSDSSDLDLAVITSDGSVPSDALERTKEEFIRRYGTHLNVIVGHGTLTSMTRQGRPGFRLWRQIATEGVPILAEGPGTG